jgi:pilus assembly protein CpaE
MCAAMNDAELVGVGVLSLVLIGPHEERRRTIAKVLAGPQASIAREVTHYPPVDDLAELLEADPDAVIVDLDTDPERALDVVENICSANSSVTVMVHSARPDSELLVRCMRAGAREFLTEPVHPNAVAEALVRSSARRDEARRQKRATGKLLVFAGAKGGSGVTTIASNFAVALANTLGNQAGSKVALVDLDLRLGDVALTLGLTTKFTALDALENTRRLDSDFLSALLAKHTSGLAVLAAPDAIPAVEAPKEAIEKLLAVVREDFAYVVVDAGSRPGEMHDALFEMANAVYLVTQVSVAELRNANRFVSRYFNGAEDGKLEIILNRFQARHLEIDESAITKALTRPAKWKIANDFQAARRALNAGVALASENSHIAHVFAEMARIASGQSAAPEKKKKFGLFG